MRHDNLIGQKFHRLTILHIERLPNRRTMALCQCDCGNTKRVLLRNIPKGHTKSCGCIFREMMRARSSSHSRKGARRPVYAWWRQTKGKSLAHSSWVAIKRRCRYPTDSGYPDYGAKGIDICDRWMDFSAFYADMGDRPEGTSIDRIDNSKGYEPGNCRWADDKTQARNRRSNRYLQYNGKSMTLADWADATGVNADALHMRLKMGWTVERALTTPVRKKKGPGDSFGEVTEAIYKETA